MENGKWTIIIKKNLNFAVCRMNEQVRHIVWKYDISI